MTQILRVGDRVLYDDAEHVVAAISGSWVRLVADNGTSSAILLTHLMQFPGFSVVAASRVTPTGVVPGHQLDDLPAEAAARARAWERHVVEVETGLPPLSAPDATPRAEYDPSRYGIGEREAAKAEELTAAGTPTSVITVQRMRRRYRENGVRGLVDQRATKRLSAYGRADERVVAAIREALTAEVTSSTGTRDRLRHRVEVILTDRYGAGTVATPPKSTFNRLVATLATGQHSFGAATTRRSLANRPDRPFTVTLATRPGQEVQIDTTPLDVLATFDDGHDRRLELTGAVDVATRTLCAGVLRPCGTKAVDTSLLLARMLVPEPMRPGWADSLRLSASRLPYRQLADIDQRMDQAAAKPVIVPESITCDRGRVYLSETFLRSCQELGISVQPAHPGTPTDKGVVERTFLSINTLFCQYVAGYTGRDVTHRGSPVRALWSITELQDLFDEWVVAGWQSRPHDGLISPDTGRRLSPNEMYTVLVSAAGYLAVPLSTDDYVELLPAEWRTINDYGIRLDGRTYDSDGLNPYRRQHSGIATRNGRWEVHYDPYDLQQVWVRDHRRGGWIHAAWTHLPMLAAPFADFTWRHAQRQAATADGARSASETATAQALHELLTRAGRGPSPAAPASGTAEDRADRAVAARTRAATVRRTPTAAPEPAVAAGVTGDSADDSADDSSDRGPNAAIDPEPGPDDAVDDVIPFGVFDAHAEARRWP